MGQGAVLREIHLERGERFVAKVYELVPRDQFVRAFSNNKRLQGDHVRYKIKDMNKNFLF